MKNILEIKNLNKKLNWKDILKNVSFSVWEWEIYWFLWPNWAGKTTTMKNILRFMNPDSWEIKVFSKNVLDEEVKKQIGFMPENTYLYKHLTGKEFLKFNWKFFWLFWQKLDQKVQNLLKNFDLKMLETNFWKIIPNECFREFDLHKQLLTNQNYYFWMSRWVDLIQFEEKWLKIWLLS